MTSRISARPWSLWKELSGEAALSCTGNSGVDEVGAALSVPGALLPGESGNSQPHPGTFLT